MAHKGEHATARRRTAAAQPSAEFVALLQAAHLSAAQVQHIQRHYGAAAVTTVRAHPYRLAQEIDGVSFQAADTVARRLGRSRTDLERLRAGICETLRRALQAGHTCLPLSMVVKRTAALLQVPQAAVEEQCWQGALEVGGQFLVKQQGRATLITLLDMWRVEERVAQALADRVRVPLPPLLPDAEEITPQVARTYALNAEQRQALHATLTGTLTVVTGGPGTGKSFFCQALAEIASRYQVPILAAAPTGRAAQRLTELSGLPAATLHRLLEYQPATGTFARHAEAPLPTSLLVVDEASMLDLFLADHTLDALPLGARLVLIGDTDQLPSVGPGQVLADVIASGIARTVRLSQLYRRTEESLITVNAHRVRAGEPPLFAPEPQADFRFVEEADPRQAIDRVVDLVAQEVPIETGLDPLTDIQVLCPMNQGACGTLVLNRALQERLNPHGHGVHLNPDTQFRIGDRVLVTHNNYRLGLFNGEAGILVHANPHKQLAVLDTGKERAVFVGRELGGLTLGYAVSVHRAQGGEFPAVILLLHDAHAPLLQRTLLYTAITRAKKLCLIVGTTRALAQAVRGVQSLQRYTGLAAAIQQAQPPSLTSTKPPAEKKA
ncbi:MAG TPA: AAA family ATPase [Candidatus Binatia bacterium]|nr:AAA family ATPase [Candidatus Binatia bacterium]